MGILGGSHIFLLKRHADALFLGFADRGQRIHRVSGKAREALGKNQVDMPGFAFGQHPLKFVAADGLRAADAAIRKRPGVFPARRALDQCAVIADLLVQRVQQTFRGNGYPGVGGNASGTDDRRCADVIFRSILVMERSSLCVYYSL